MKKIFILIVMCFFLVVALGCKTDSGNYFADTIKGKATNAAWESLTTKATDSISEEKSKANNDYVPSDADAHYIQPSDYFISDREFPNKGWIYVHLAKVVTAPTAQTKNEGQFMRIHDGKEIWSKYYWKSRIATKADIRIGAIIISFDDNVIDAIYKAPKNKDTARNGQWFMGKIIDTTDLYKGYVTVAGGYKVDVNNIRIPLK
ncbi:MAG: hypothetical protein ACUVRK_04105 [Spirochaetota bacterium]